MSDNESKPKFDWSDPWTWLYAAFIVYLILGLFGVDFH